MTKTTLLRMPQVETATGLKKSALYQRMKEGTFPAAVRLGPKSVAWRSDEVQKWIENRPRVIQEGKPKAAQSRAGAATFKSEQRRSRLIR